MTRLLTAAAVAALLSSPVMAQSVSPSDQGAPSSTWQQQGSPGTSSPGTSSSESMPGSQGLSGQSQGLTSETPTDCGPQDPRPECQTAQLPTPEGAQDQQAQQPGLGGPSSVGDAPGEMPADDSRYQGAGPEPSSGAESPNR